MLEKYINYGECEICHKMRSRLMGANICGDCLEDYIESTKVVENDNSKT